MSDTPYDPPAQDAALSDDVDPAEARPGFVVGLLGFLVVVAGLFAIIYWPQLVVFEVRIYSWMKIFPPLITLAGLAVVPLGAFVATGRFWASAVVTPVLLVLGLFQMIWAFWAFMNGAFTILYPFGPILTGAGAIAAVISVVLNKRISDARRALLYG